jgi:hypothetical protein
MQYKRCKCGEVEIWDSGYPEYPCQGCEKCNTTCSSSPTRHIELKPHIFTKIIYSQSTGKPEFQTCGVCGIMERLKEEVKE